MVSTALISNDAAEPQYNGNISQVRWNVNSENGGKQEYNYYYDAMNRLTKAQYKHLSNVAMQGAYTTQNISYDLNGNIESLTRNSDVNEDPLNPAVTAIDDLLYYYTGNQLQKVEDDISLDKGFIDKDNTTDYDYDDNGNMIVDRNKDITVAYNYLNLPERVDFGNGDYTVYIYDATGVKRTKEIHKNGEVTTTDYTGLVEYINGEVDIIHTDEGRITAFGGNYNYEYYLKDHLGNNRIVFGDDGTGTAEILQENDYYAFGGRIAKGVLNDNKYLYNGKELQEELGWYDYGARFYDPALGRWHVVDAMSENAYDWSPYNYGFNNPILMIDPDGNFPFPGGDFLVNAVADGLKDMGAERAAGFVRTYGDALIIDPVSDIVDVVNAGKEEGVAGVAKEMDPTGLSSIPDAVETVKDAANGDKEAQGTVAASAVIVGLNLKQGIKSMKNAKSSPSNVHGNSVNSTKPTGNYTNTHQSGKTYSGVGNKARMNQSAKRVANKYNDPVAKQKFKSASNKKTAYIREHKAIQKNGGAGNTQQNYNVINSPGKKLLENGN